MTARARWHALKRNDENVNEAGRGNGRAYANARIARRSTSCTSRYAKEKDERNGEHTQKGEKDNSRWRESRWSFREGILLCGE